MIKIFCLNKTDKIEEEEKMDIKEILTNKSNNYQIQKFLLFLQKMTMIF